MTGRVLLPALLSLFLASGAETSRAPFTGALLDITGEAAEGTAPPAAETLGKLRDVAELVRGEMKRGSSRAVALNHVVFESLGFVREVDDRDLRFVFLPSVLAARRGSCVGLGTLYIALGELLGFRVEGVLVPGHFFVRVDEGGRFRNVELLRRGEEMPDAWYTKRFGVPAGSSGEYLRALSPREVLGVVEYDVGNERRAAARFSEARRAYRLATSLFPALSEAHASLGATLQVLGDLDAAQASYAAALGVNPALPGVAANLELLHDERAARRALPANP